MKMWILKGPKGEIHYLLPGKENVVGRKGGDLVLVDDQSISRKHAVITVDHSFENWDDPDKLPDISLTDAGSKYGTVINPSTTASKMVPNSTQQLHDGDQIQFGVQWNIWRLVHEPLVVVMSTLTTAQKKSVKDIVGNLGGHIVNHWKSKCTHLTMCNFTMTVKAIGALACGRAIVTPEFWKSYMTAVQNKKELPNYEDFIPLLAETMINKNEVSFLINLKRKTVFCGKQFLFFSPQQSNEYACLITAAGGIISILDRKVVSDEDLIHTRTIVMQHAFPNSQTPQPFMEVINVLQTNGKRVIPVSEIGLAILHCSIEKYCNPSFNFASTMLGSNRHATPTLTSQKVLAMETQEEESPDEGRQVYNVKENVIIPESGTVTRKANDIAHAEESEPTLLLELQSETEKREPQNYRTPKAKIRPRTSESQKRSRSPEYEDAQPSKRNTYNKGRNYFIIQQADEEDEGLFDFASDRKALDEDDEEEDSFAFKDTLPIEKVEVSDSMASTQPVVNLKRRLSSEEENSMPHHLNKRLAQVDISARSKNEKQLDRNGEYQQDFLSASDIKKENNNSSIVTVKALIAQSHPCKRTCSTNDVHDIKNFKKFRKVQTLNKSILPRIISGRDFVPFQKDKSALCSLINDDEDMNDDDDDDWAFRTSTQLQKKGQSRRLGK